MSFSELQCAFLHFCHTNKISLITEVLPQSVAPRGLLHTSRHFVVVVVCDSKPNPNWLKQQRGTLISENVQNRSGVKTGWLIWFSYEKIYDFSVSALSFISIVLRPTYLTVAQMIVAPPYFDIRSDWFSQYHLCHKPSLGSIIMARGMEYTDC